MGQRYDPARDLIFMAGGILENGETPAINGRAAPLPLTLSVGTTYRLRVINILPADPFQLQLHTPDSVMQTWRPIAGDGADLPPSLRRIGPADARMGVGETCDFEWTPSAVGEVQLVMRLGPQTSMRQRIIGR